MLTPFHSHPLKSFLPPIIISLTARVSHRKENLGVTAQRVGAFLSMWLQTELLGLLVVV